MSMVDAVMKELAELRQVLAMVEGPMANEHVHSLETARNIIKQITIDVKQTPGRTSEASSGPGPMVSRPTVYMTPGSCAQKRGTYHYLLDCPDLGNDEQAAEDNDLETMLAVPGHMFRLCDACRRAFGQ